MSERDAWDELYEHVQRIVDARDRRLDRMGATLNRLDADYQNLARRITKTEEAVGLRCPNCGYPKAPGDDCAQCGRKPSA